MPTYEYGCRACGEQLEVVQSFHDDPLTKCPKCGGELRKIFGNVGIVFKGSGFYKTDSRASSKSSETASGDKKPAEPASSTADSSATPAKAPEPAASTSTTSTAPSTPS